MKKILIILLALVMLVSVVSCGKSAKPAKDNVATVESKDNDAAVESDHTAVESNGSVAESVEDQQNGWLGDVSVGDYIRLGKYEQDNIFSNGSEEIEWLVLDKSNNRALLISKYALDWQRYNSTYAKVTWESSSIREWLNVTFFNEAFSPDEQDIILSTSIAPDVDPDSHTDIGNYTTDKVFLLSLDEVNNYFASDESRQCVVTDYAVSKGAWVGAYYVDDRPACAWWLRTSELSTHSTIIEGSGSVDYRFGRSVAMDGLSVRPAIWIRLR